MRPLDRSGNGIPGRYGGIATSGSLVVNGSGLAGSDESRSGGRSSRCPGVAVTDDGPDRFDGPGLVVDEPSEARYRARDLCAACGLAGSELARAIGVDPVTVRRWERSGLTVWQADRAAIRVGLHPALVWPHWLRLAVPEVVR